MLFFYPEDGRSKFLSDADNFLSGLHIWENNKFFYLKYYKIVYNCAQIN
jgi:hypothetical protein